MQRIAIRPGQKRSFRKRVTTFFSICLFLLMLLLVQTAYLQLVRGDEYSTRAYRNRARLLPIIPHRGEVYDREKKRKLITNKKSLCITLVPASVPRDPDKRRAYFKRLARVLSISTNTIVKRLQKESWDIYTPKLLKENVSYRTITRIAESIEDFPGVFWENRPMRVYTLTNTLAHTLGYIGYINKKEMKRLADKGYHPGSLIGKTGIEKKYDEDLRGEEGILEREVDARNRIINQKVKKKPVHGRPLVLTIDSDLQMVAQEAIGDKRGAVVVSKPATGEILALLSNPGFDVNVFYNRINREVFARIQHDPDKPLFNRALQAMYPPSSVFKLVTASAGLESKRLSVSDTHNCDGGHLLGDRYFKCWSTHGRQNLLQAIMNSCNVYFYKASLDIGSSRILDYAQKYGLGEKTGIDLPAESKGFVPTKAWKKKTAGRPWLDGDTLNLAIGQGDILVTPIQVNMLTSAVYNEGVAYKPFLLKEIHSVRFQELIEKNEGREVLFRNDVSDRTFAILKKGMRMVVRSGTGLACKIPDFPVSGKTGTAQNVKKKKPHAWFSGFAPAGSMNHENAIAVTVICENAGGGGGVAAPIAAKIFRAWKRKHFSGVQGSGQ